MVEWDSLIFCKQTSFQMAAIGTLSSIKHCTAECKPIQACIKNTTLTDTCRLHKSCKSLG